MNILHMKYAVEVARAGSINRASETLLVAQPNISRAIKELESDLGITLFDRTARGMLLTPKGEEFLRYARQILRQIDEVENLYKNKAAPKRRFSISVPRASYISDAFARFSRRIGPEPSEIFYNETNTSQAISNILMADYRLGIIRYPRQHDKYFKSLLREKGLSCELITEFRPQLLMHRDCPLNQKGEIFFKDLEPHIEVAHSDAYVPPAIPLSAVRKEEPPDNISRRIFVFERAGQFELLCANPETFMWVSPVPQTQLERYGLVQRTCRDDQRIYRDLLIYRADYEMTPWDNTFLEELRQAQKTHIPPPANVNES